MTTVPSTTAAEESTMSPVQNEATPHPAANVKSKQTSVGSRTEESITETLSLVSNLVEQENYSQALDLVQEFVSSGGLDARVLAFHGWLVGLKEENDEYVNAINDAIAI